MPDGEDEEVLWARDGLPETTRPTDDDNVEGPLDAATLDGLFEEVRDVMVCVRRFIMCLCTYSDCSSLCYVASASSDGYSGAT
jgi:hypothetical protein